MQPSSWACLRLLRGIAADIMALFSYGFTTGRLRIKPFVCVVLSFFTGFVTFSVAENVNRYQQVVSVLWAPTDHTQYYVTTSSSTVLHAPKTIKWLQWALDRSNNIVAY